MNLLACMFKYFQLLCNYEQPRKSRITILKACNFPSDKGHLESISAISLYGIRTLIRRSVILKVFHT